MKFLEVQEGISINVNKIEGIKKKTEDTCEVYIGNKAYLATISYENLLGLIKIEDMVDNGLSKSQSMENTMKKLDKVLGNTQHFSG